MVLPQQSRIGSPTPRTWSQAGALIVRLAMPLILLVAVGVRLYGIDWDDGALFHPDERAILMCVNDLGNEASYYTSHRQCGTEAAPWNPGWFPYGSFPIYLLKGIETLASPFTSLDLFGLRFVARAVSALADVMTVLIVYLLGTRLYGRRVGLLASSFTTVAVLHIQLSHFYAVDTLLTFLTVLSLFLMVRVAYRGGLGDSALAGLVVGLALATKVSAVPLLLPLFLAHLARAFGIIQMTLLEQFRSLGSPLLAITRALRAWREASPRLSLGMMQNLAPFTPSDTRHSILGLGIALVSAVGVFFITQPYVVLDWHGFLRDVSEQSEMVRGIRDYPYIRQYENTTPYLYQVRQLFLFGLGPPLGMLAWAGLLFVFGMAFWRGTRGDLILLAWAVSYFAIVGGFQVKFMRYLLPITPILLLFGARLLDWIITWATTHRRELVPLAWGLVIFVLLSSSFYAIAYLRVYTAPHTAVRASEWINSTVPSGEVLLREHWEESLPDLGRYILRELPLYESDNVGKMQLLANELAFGDYLVLYSNRLYGTIPRLPDRYPISTRYYHLLFGGALGYELAHFETQTPSFLGVAFSQDTFKRPGLPVPEALALDRPAFLTLNFGYADESFTVYDHPLVLIFRNTGRLSREELELRLLTKSGDLGESRRMLMPREEWLVQRAGGTWREIIKTDNPVTGVSVVAWLLLVYAVSLATLPITLMVFRRFPDRGYLLGRPLGILLISYLPWLLAALKWAPFTRMSILTVLGLLTVVSIGLCLRFGREMSAFVRQRWRLLVLGEVVFLGVFLVFLSIRMANPDLWHPYRGGEKPMDLAYLLAVLRSTFMPPYDPWYAGGVLNYYYFGQFLVATLIKVLGIAPTLAYNLVVPLWAAMAGGASFSLAYNLAAGPAQRASEKKGMGKRGRASPVVAGLFGTIFVVILGNLDGAIQVVQGVWRSISSGSFGNFDYWRSTRMMSPDPPGWEITEFPFFTFLFADLHAHMLALPFVLLVLGLLLHILVQARRSDGKNSFLVTLLPLGLSIGALSAINVWDFPVYLIVGAVVLAIASYFRCGSLGWRWLIWMWVPVTVLVAFSILLFLPYHLRLHYPYGGMVGSPAKTAVWQYLAIHGLFIFLVASLLLYEIRRASSRLPLWLPICRIWQRVSALSHSVSTRGQIQSDSVSTARPDGIEKSVPNTTESVAGPILMSGIGKRENGNPRMVIVLATLGVLGSMTLLVTLSLVGHLTTAFLLVVATLVLVVGVPRIRTRSRDAPYTVFALLLIGAACVVGIGVEFVALGGDIGRMNTVFKLYFQGWVFLGLAAAYSLWRLGYPSGVLRYAGLGSTFWLVAVALLLLSAGIYPILGTRERIRDRFTVLPMTLDGMAYMQAATYDDPNGEISLSWDAQGIAWLQENIDGSPVILEGLTPMYRWGSRVSIYTGLPTVIGWDWHQRQQRCGIGPCESVDIRLAEVEQMYSTPNLAKTAELLERYEVDYIYVGEVERLYYPASGLEKFDRMVEDGTLWLDYENQRVKVYRVVH